MVTFIKYPLTDAGLKTFKSDKFFIADKIVKHKGFLVVYPELEIVSVLNPKTKIMEEKIIYPKENKIAFYCKSIQEKDILKFKGGFNIEKCSQKEWQVIGKKWYVENGIKLPKKLKKKICGKIK